MEEDDPQLVPFPGGHVLIFTDEDGDPAVTVDYLGVETMVYKASRDSSLPEKVIVQVDGKPGISERSILILLNNTTVFRGHEEPDGAAGFEDIVRQLGS